MEPASDARSEQPSNLDFGEGSSSDAIEVACTCRVENTGSREDEDPIAAGSIYAPDGYLLGGIVYLREDDIAYTGRTEEQEGRQDDTLDGTDGDSVSSSTNTGNDDSDDEDEDRERLLDVRIGKRKADKVPVDPRPASSKRTSAESDRSTSQQHSAGAKIVPNTFTVSRSTMARQHKSADAQRSTDLAINEYRVELELQATRHSDLAASTENMYSRYQMHWTDWCARKGYTDHLVLSKRFQVYMSENLADETDDERGIYPIRVKRRRRRKDVSGAHEEGRLDTLPSYETVDAYIKAACDLYETQRADPTNVAMHSEPHPRSRNIRGLMKSYHLKVSSTKKSAHSASLTIEDGYELESLKQVMRKGWSHNYPRFRGGRHHKLVGLRQRLNASWSHFMMTRGENMRMATLSNISSHAFRLNSQDGYFALGVTLYMLQGKTNREGKENFGVVVRNKDVEVCPVNSLAFYLFEQWVYDGAPLDNPDWITFYLMPGKSNNTGNATKLSTSAHYRASKNLWEDAGVVTSKPTHAHRGAGARHAQNAGADIPAIEQHGSWGHGRVATHYLTRIPHKVAFQMAGCTHPNERLWLARNTVIPPLKLQREVFPFIEDHFKDRQGYEDWQQWLENIMLDRDLYYKRETTKRMQITFADILKARMLLLLAHLRKVILQDAVALINLPQEPFLYGDHHILQHSVFKGPLFLKFKEDLLESMATAVSPMSDSLMANAPAIHNEFGTVNTRMSRFEHEIRKLFQESNAQTVKELKRLEEALVNQHRAYIGASNQSKIELITQFWSAVRDISLSVSNTAHTAQLNFLSSLGPSQLDKRAELQPIQQQREKQQHNEQQHNEQQHNEQQHIEQQHIEQQHLEQQHLEQQHNEQQHNEQQHNEQHNEQQRIGQHLQNPPVAQIPRRLPPLKERRTLLETELASRYVHYPPPASVDLVDVTMLPRSDPLRQQWKEWFQGTEGRPAIWSLNKTFGTRWRKGHGNTLAKTFSVKKAIIYYILDIVLEIEGATLSEREESALQVVEDKLKVMTLNRYYLEVAGAKRQPGEQRGEQPEDQDA